MTEKVYDCHHELILIYIGTKNYHEEQNLNYTYDHF